MSKQRMAGLCGPRHAWEESDQEKSRSFYSEAASEQGPYRSSFYSEGSGTQDYSGDELAWEWREATRMRVQDAFEFCVTSRRGGSGTADLRWTSVSPGAAYGGFGNRNRRYMDRHRRRRSAKGKEPSNEKAEFSAEDVAASDEAFEGIEKVLAAVRFPSTSSPSRRGVLSEELFAAPSSYTHREPRTPTIEPLQYSHEESGPSTGMFTGLAPPKMAKRNSKDKVPGSSTAVAGAPLMHLPYPFSKPGTGQVSSKDLVLGSEKSKSSDSAKSSRSGTSKSKTTASGSESASGSGEDNEEEEIEDEEEEEEEEEDDEEEDSEEHASGSMSSLGHPLNSPSRYLFGARRSHRRTPSGVSSGVSSGANVSGGSHAHSRSLSSSQGTRSAMGVSMLSQSTGNRASTDSETGIVEGRRLNPGSSPLSGGGSGIPMPPRHPHPQGQGRGRSETAPFSSFAVGTLHTTPIAFPTVHQPRRRADSGRGIMADPALLHGSDIEGQHELNDEDLDELPDDDEDPMGDNDDNEDEQGEQEDRVGLLGVPASPLASHSRISLAASHSSSSGSLEARSRTHSSFSIHSRSSRRSGLRARSRSRTHSMQGGPSVRERASSLGASMRSLIQGTSASLTQLDLIMRGATGPAAALGGGSRPRSRVNSSMARLEEDVVLSTTLGPTTESSESNGSAEVSSPVVGKIRQELEEGYSSGGTHSRSGSESISAENYTFGRPVLFMRPVQEQQGQQQDLVEEDEEEEVVLVEGSSARASARASPNRSVPAVSMTRDEGGDQQHESVSVSVSESFYSQVTATNPSTSIPVPVLSGSSSMNSSEPSASPERQGLAIPWNQQQQQQRLLVPPVQRREHHDTAGTSGSSGSSPAGISTADASFITAAPTMEGNTTATDSSRSWEGGSGAVGRVRLSEMEGMVERPGEDMGSGAAGTRVV